MFTVLIKHFVMLFDQSLVLNDLNSKLVIVLWSCTLQMVLAMEGRYKLNSKNQSINGSTMLK